VIVLDVEDGGFAALPSPPPPEIVIPLALSPDGRHVLLQSIEDNGRTMSMVWHTVMTAERGRITAPQGCFDFRAAVSPDGATIATLSQDDGDSGFVDLIDLATLNRRRLWSCEGGASMHETSIAWSPDGRWLATTYYDAPTDELATAVIDAADGTVVAQHQYRVVLGCPNGTWVDNDRLVLIEDRSDEFVPPLHLLDVTSGSSRRFSRPPQWMHYVALLDGRLLARGYAGEMCLTSLDGDGSEPFLTLPADLGIGTFDIAASAIDPV
jgi:hypothetical protein